ncbi:hypothetical protein ACHAWF_006163 [Thalassiosira exigua]
MPHILCFTDLLAQESCADASAGKGGVVTTTEGGASAPSPAASTGTNQRPCPTVLLVREENKKSSFALQCPVALRPESRVRVEADVEDKNDRPTSDERPSSDGSGSDGLRKNSGSKETFYSTACITSHVSINQGESLPLSVPHEAVEIFLFGGFELIANIKTVVVHITHSNDAPKTAQPSSSEESYLTTCKGVPVRDIPHLAEFPLYTDGSKPEVETSGVGTSKSNESVVFYKFILASPGGPKPVARVRLKLVRNFSLVHGPVIIRTLKVKGRLSDTQQQPSFPNSSANSAMPGNGKKDGMNNLTAMMAMMGAGSTGMMGQTHMQQQQHQHNQQQEARDRQQEMRQAEIISSVVGLGIFLKSSEERTMKQVETILTKMEARIMNRLDHLVERLDAIEQHISETSNNLDPHE